MILRGMLVCFLAVAIVVMLPLQASAAACELQLEISVDGIPTAIADTANVLARAGSIGVLTASDPMAPSALFSAKVADVSPDAFVAAGKPISLPADLPTISKVTILEQQPGESLCQRNITLFSFPSTWIVPLPNTDAGGTHVMAQSFDKTVNIAYTIVNGSNNTIDADLGPIGMTHVHIHGTSADLSTYAIDGKLIDADNTDALSGQDAVAVPAAVAQACPGFPNTIADKTSTASMAIGHVSVQRSFLQIVCDAPLRASLSLNVQIGSGKAIPVEASATLDGSKLTVVGVQSGQTAPLVTLNQFTSLTVQSITFTKHMWQITANISANGLGGEASSAADLVITSAGISLASGRPDLQLGRLRLQILAFACVGSPWACSGQVGIELPGFESSSSDTPFVATFSENLGVALTSAQALSSSVGGAKFSLLRGTQLTLRHDVATIKGQGSITLPNVATGMTLTQFDLESTPETVGMPAKLTISAHATSPVGLDSRLFKLNNVRADVKYDSSNVEADGLVLNVISDGKLTVDSGGAEPVFLLNATARDMSATLSLGTSVKPVFAIQSDKVTLTKSTFFDRIIEGKCADSTNAFFTDNGEDRFEICVGVHLVPGVGVNDDRIDLDVTLSPPQGGSNYRVESALLSYDSDAPDGSRKGPITARIAGRSVEITSVSLKYTGEKADPTSMYVDPPSWAGNCADEVTGTMRFNVDTMLNAKAMASTSSTAMDASTGFGSKCLWFQADGTAGIAIAPNVSAVIYHTEFATYRSSELKHPAFHVLASGDLAYQNYTLAIKELSYDDFGNGKTATRFRVNGGQTLLKNIPGIIGLVGGLVGGLLIHH